MRVNRPVLSTQAKRWRAEASQGLTLRQIARAAGRHQATVRYHLDFDPLDAMRARALRLEGLFASCNRALAGAAR